MNDSTPHDTTPAAPATQGAAGMGLSALQRRRLLLRGVGKGGVVLAAAVPLASFATVPLLKTTVVDGKAHLCTLSGVQSVLASSSVVTQECSGKSAEYWLDSNLTWPTFMARGQSVTRSSTFGSVFGGTGGNTVMTLEQLLGPGFSGEEKTWVRALLNSAQFFPMSFPYDTAFVVTSYGDMNLRATALEFFTRWV